MEEVGEASHRVEETLVEGMAATPILRSVDRAALWAEPIETTVPLEQRTMEGMDLTAVPPPVCSTVA